MANFEPKSYDELLEEFFLQLSYHESSAIDRSPGSLMHVLGRAFAKVQSEAELDQKRLAEQFYVSVAQGSDLDRRAQDFGLLRRVGTKASGKLLAISTDNTQTVSPGTVLTEPKSTAQFRVIDGAAVTVSPLAETLLSIESVSTGLSQNLAAGTRLISSVYPRVVFTVGEYRQSDGIVRNGLRNGRDSETDAELRERVTNLLTSKRGVNESVLRTFLLNLPQVLWTSVQTTSPGILQVWVDVVNDSDVALVKTALLEAGLVAAGVFLDLRRAQVQLLDITLNLTPLPGTDLDELTAAVSQRAQSFLLDLDLGQRFSRYALQQAIAPLVAEVVVSEPVSDISPSANTVVRPADIFVRYAA